MRLITNADEELFQTVTIAARLGKAATVIDRLNAVYDDRWDDAEAGFQTALAAMAVLQVSGTYFEKHAGYHRVVETLDDVLQERPDHWLARYCRIRLRALIPTGYGPYKDYLAGEQAKAIADADELIELQPAADWQPYFAAPYLLAAQMQVTQGNDEAAAQLVATAAEHPTTPITFPALGAIMSEAFLAMHHILPPAQRDPLASMMSELFAGRPSVLALLAPVVSSPGPVR